MKTYSNMRLLFACLSLLAILSVAVLILSSSPLWAKEESAKESAKKAAPQVDHKELVKVFEAGFPDIEIEQVNSSPISGLYEVIFGDNLVYLSSDGRYLIQGGMLDIQTREDLTKLSLQKWDKKSEPSRQKTLDDYPEENMVVYRPDDAKYQLTVFTDTSCGYCRKFHRELPELLDAGVTVRYLFFPRSGLGKDSTSYTDMISVWCAEDKRTALTEAKAGQKTKPKQCANPIEEHYNMARRFGVSGTPTIYTEKGRKIGGYLAAPKLLKILKSEAVAAK